MPAISPAELRRILDKLGITLAELAHLCRVHPVSARRWGSTGVPDGPAAILIRLLAASKVSARAIEQMSRAPESR
jgi:DNA-binding transcriptional regulator YiaG